MKNATAHAQKLGVLIKKLAKKYPASSGNAPTTHDSEGQPLTPVGHVVYAFLEWESTVRAAELAYKRLLEIAVDDNDLRVCHTVEMIEVLGPRYPRVEERTARLRDVLNEIFNREHDTSLAAIMDRSKRDARHYLDSLPGMVPYVAARTMLFGFGGHAIPADDRLVSLLAEEDAIDPTATLADTVAYLDRNIKASDGIETFRLFRAWADDAPIIKPKPQPKPALPTIKPVPVRAASVPAEKTTAPSKSKGTKKTTRTTKKTSKATSQKASVKKTSTKKASTKKASANKAAPKTRTVKKKK